IPTPTPTPAPVVLGTLYLHNDPTPPDGDTAGQPLLSMDGSAPSATTLYNYDSDSDAGPGIVIARGGSGPGESDPGKYQAWRSPAFPFGAVIQSDVTVTLWTAMKDFSATKQGSLLIYLRDFNGTSYTTISAALFTSADWLDGSSAWQTLSRTFPIAGRTLAAGHQLELKIIVTEQSDDDLWFAYDTTAYPARIEIP
ncbi:MAG: hypothetical protein ACE5D3_05285, partial [Candidatus Binatia bacterium]